MERDLKIYPKTCHLCQIYKHRNKPSGEPYYAVIPKGNAEIVYIDILGPLVRNRGGRHMIVPDLTNHVSVKLLPIYEGPYTVIKCGDQNYYHITKVFNVNSCSV